MPVRTSYPGVYIEEIPSGVRTIAGVSTSDTAFIGFFTRGPMNEPVRITSYGDFERQFGGLDSRSEASYAIQQYYLNGGSVAWVVRVADSANLPLPAVLELDDEASLPNVALSLEAASPGLWGQNVQVAIGHITGSTDTFNLVVREVARVAGKDTVVASEIHRNLSMSSASSRYVEDVINEDSDLINVTAVGTSGVGIPAETATGGDDVTSSTVVNNPANTSFIALAHTLPGDPVNDGQVPDATGLINGMNTLDNIAPAVFNILCIPAAANLSATALSSVYAAAETYCENHRAFLIIDIPASVSSEADMTGWMGAGNPGNGLRHNNAAVYFPRLTIPDRLNENRPRNVGPSGTLAGVYARIDATRGIWKAPAGTEATLRGANVAAKLTDLQNGGLNPLGVNVLRTFPIHGNICWGSRTMNGADQQASEWKYVPVRRLALYIEESLFQGLKWVVFEPNDEPLWAQIRLNVGAFMNNLFRQGAFQGQTPREAYLVKCDSETTTQNDINNGVVNIVVGFAPLKPAEFVIIKIQQLAGQVAV